MPFLTILQLYRCCQFYCWGKLNYTQKITNILEITDKLYHIMVHRVHLGRSGIQVQTLVVIDTDCTGSCKSNYHTIMTMTAPYWTGVVFLLRCSALFTLQIIDILKFLGTCQRGNKNRISQMDSQYNGPTKEDKRTNNYPQKTMQKKLD